MSRLVLSIAVDNAPTGKALGIKEAIAMDLEKYGRAGRPHHRAVPVLPPPPHQRITRQAPHWSIRRYTSPPLWAVHSTGSRGAQAPPDGQSDRGRAGMKRVKTYTDAGVVREVKVFNVADRDTIIIIVLPQVVDAYHLPEGPQPAQLRLRHAVAPWPTGRT